MLRVPGSDGDLFTIKSLVGDVHIVYSPLDYLKTDRANPDKQVVIFAIGFETTAPANAMLAWRAREDMVNHLSLLASHVLVPPTLEAILSAPDNRVNGFLGPGHVCAGQTLTFLTAGVYLHETKNGSLRVLALNDLAARVLESLPQDGSEETIFAGVDAVKLSVYTRRLFQSLTIEDASLHSLRRTCASWLVMEGATYTS